MDPRIAQSTTFQGRRLARRQVADIRTALALLPAHSRDELAKTVCGHLDRARPGAAVSACPAMLRTLQAHGLATLPPKREPMQRPGHPPARARTTLSDPQAPHRRRPSPASAPAHRDHRHPARRAPVERLHRCHHRRGHRPSAIGRERGRPSARQVMALLLARAQVPRPRPEAVGQHQPAFSLHEHRSRDLGLKPLDDANRPSPCASIDPETSAFSLNQAAGRNPNFSRPTRQGASTPPWERRPSSAPSTSSAAPLGARASRPQAGRRPAT